MKGSQILAWLELDCGDIRAGISPRAGSHSPAWEDVRNNAPHGGQMFLCRRFQTYVGGVVSAGSEVKPKHATLLRPRGARQFVIGPGDACTAIQSCFQPWVMFPPEDSGDPENGILIRHKYRNDCTCLCTFLYLFYLSFGRLFPHGSSHFYREQLESRGRARTLRLPFLGNTNAAVSCSWSSCATSGLFHQYFMGCCFSTWVS